MANNIQLIVFPIKDAAKAKAFYSSYLGMEPYIDSDFYIGYRLGDFEVGLDPNGSTIISYINVDDANAVLQNMTASGAEVVQEPMDVGGGLLIAKIKDTDGNVVGLRQQPK